MNPRLRFILAFAFAALLWFGYAPVPATTAGTALAVVLYLVCAIGLLMVVVAIFHGAEISDGRADAPASGKPRGHDYYGENQVRRQRARR